MGLKRNHPELFAKAREIEKSAGDGYTWVRGKNLDELVEHAEKREKELGIIATDRSSKLTRWQEILEQEIDAIWKSSLPSREIVELRNMILVGILDAEDANERQQIRGLHYNKDLIKDSE